MSSEGLNTNTTLNSPTDEHFINKLTVLGLSVTEQLVFIPPAIDALKFAEVVIGSQRQVELVKHLMHEG